VATLPRKRAEAWWEVKGVIAAIHRQPRVGFPVNLVWNRPTGAQVFAADDRGNGNEASTEQEDSSGSMRFEDASCQRCGRAGEKSRPAFIPRCDVQLAELDQG
jgi:hypothetical protein